MWQRDGPKQPGNGGGGKPFGGSAVNKAHKQLRQRGHTDSDVTYPPPNQILDSLEGYLDNIFVAATQAVEKGVSLAELSVSLAISIDTVLEQQK